ncbi:hypothetical protein DRN79_03895 [Methanosarcinales archaeon]|nr:MAG: hypothetical protein DRN79_03895 [Methanosarcinales archaeon]
MELFNTSTPHRSPDRQRHDEEQRGNVRPEIQIVPHRLLSERTGMRLIDELKTVGLVSRIGYAGPGDMIGYIWVEVYGFHSGTMERIRTICDEHLPFGYDLSIGRFTKHRKTVSDYIREDMMRRRQEGDVER